MDGTRIATLMHHVAAHVVTYIVTFDDYCVVFRDVDVSLGAQFDNRRKMEREKHNEKKGATAGSRMSAADKSRSQRALDSSTLPTLSTRGGMNATVKEDKELFHDIYLFNKPHWYFLAVVRLAPRPTY